VDRDSFRFRETLTRGHVKVAMHKGQSHFQMPLGPDAVGYLATIQNGYVFISIDARRASKPRDQDALGGHRDERASAASGFVGLLRAIRTTRR